MTRAEFEHIVTTAIESLPPRFARHLDNLEVVIEDAPSHEALRSLGLDPRRDTLFGLYDGLSVAERIDAQLPMPDRIIIYFKPLVQSFRSPARLRREITLTLLHEIGHAFGLDDEDMGE